MNAMVFGKDTGKYDWAPDRAIGPTDDRLYEAEVAYHDSELSSILGKPLSEIRAMATAQKRRILMQTRKEHLHELIHTYYQERGWNANGVPTLKTLKKIGLWNFLSEEAKDKITALNN
jgi:aldehyde:ferredoxin oxidoreductase